MGFFVVFVWLVFVFFLSCCLFSYFCLFFVKLFIFSHVVEEVVLSEGHSGGKVPLLRIEGSCFFC